MAVWLNEYNYSIVFRLGEVAFAPFEPTMSRSAIPKARGYEQRLQLWSQMRSRLAMSMDCKIMRPQDHA